jgi:hypothetical protein
LPQILLYCKHISSLLLAKLFAGSLNLFAEALQGLLPELVSPLLKDEPRAQPS